MSPREQFVLFATLLALVGVLAYLLLVAVKQIMFLRDDLAQAERNQHARCIGAVAAYVGNEWAAQILEVAAEDYDSARGQAELDRITKMRYQPGGPPIPTIWMQERAERLRVYAQEIITETEEIDA